MPSPAPNGTRQSASLYDRNDYYGNDPGAQRVTALLDGALHWLDRRRAAFVHRVVGGKPSRVLDVGAGDGKFLHFVRELGHDVAGTTASQRSQSAAMRRYGIGLDYCDVGATDFPAGPFDVITYWHVFEHLGDPAGHVASWQRLLTKGARVIIEVPNAEALGARFGGSAWLGSGPIHHINMCSKAELERTLREAGFAIEQTGQLSAKFTYVYLWSGMLGGAFPGAYDFDSVLDIIRFPLRSLRDRPLATLNALAAVVYMLPAIVPLAAVAPLLGRGEVWRIVARKTNG